MLTSLHYPRVTYKTSYATPKPCDVSALSGTMKSQKPVRTALPLSLGYSDPIFSSPLVVMPNYAISKVPLILPTKRARNKKGVRHILVEKASGMLVGELSVSRNWSATLIG